MSIEAYIKDNKLTALGLERAKRMFNDMQCDRLPCAGCCHRDKDTGGPGGEGCPAVGISREEVDHILLLYMGRPPRYDKSWAVDSRIRARLGRQR